MPHCRSGHFGEVIARYLRNYYKNGTQDAKKSSVNRNGENTAPTGNTVLLD